jgi:CRP/FNR family transcriptional regulator, anaerobic regulatory protein
LVTLQYVLQNQFKILHKVISTKIVLFTMTELEQYIKKYFDIISNADIKSIASLFTTETVSKGKYLLIEGKQCNKLSFVQSGLLRIYTVTDEGKEVTQWISEKGFFTGDISSFIFNSPSKVSIQALTDVELSSISNTDYNNIGNKVAFWHEFERKFIISCFIMMEERVMRHLSMTAEERYNYFFNQNPELFNQVPLQYIASMLGMTPETFSRIRKKQLL